MLRDASTARRSGVLGISVFTLALSTTLVAACGKSSGGDAFVAQDGATSSGSSAPAGCVSGGSGSF